MAEIKKVGCERLELGALSGKTMGPGGPAGEGPLRVVRGWPSFLTGVTRAVAACPQAF